ncbi:MAG TPA: hypothetical protein PKY31_03275 [Spirochaetota bacterium]|nr:hypothetical protein [Spirochaetota bacterium]
MRAKGIGTGPIALVAALLLVQVLASYSYASPGAGDDYKYERAYLEGRLAEFIAAHGDMPIAEIRVTGLVRTRPGYVLGHTDSRPGEPLSGFRPHDLVNHLKRRNIFSDIDIQYLDEGGKAVIQIAVKEKWTLIPLPFYYSNSNNTSYGFYLLESNLFGYGKSLFLGGTGSTLGWNGMLGYIDPEVAGSDFRLNLFLSYKNTIYRNGDIHGNIEREYHALERFVRIDAGYSFNSALAVYLSGAHRVYDVDEGYAEGFNLPASQEQVAVSAIADIRKQVFYEYFYYGLTGRIEAARHVPADGSYDEFSTFECRLMYAERFFSYNRISLALAGYAGNAPDVALNRIGGKPGFKTLPAEIIVSRRHLSGTLSWERPVLRFNWGAVTLLAFWEQGAYDDGSGIQRFYGPGAGVLVYLKRVAFPAVGFNYAVNLDTREGEFSASVGFSM